MTTESMKPYPAYKDSGIEWIGEIPEGWDVKPLKYVARNVQTGITPPSLNDDYYENGDIDWFTPGDFNDSLILHDSKRKITELAIIDKVTKVYDANSVLIVGIGATLGKVGIVKKKSSSNQQINAITFNSNYNPYFGAYYLKSISNIVVSLSNASTLAILNQFQTKNILIIAPPVLEQQSIATFLDNQTAKIDTLIENKQKQIELLKEERTAIINQAVTKGLNPDVPMRDSGIEWLGEIPEHWGITKLKLLADIKLSNIDKKSKEDELAVKLCNYVDVYYNDNITNNIEFMVATARKDQINALSLKKGDVLITKDSESPNDIAVPAFVPESLSGIVCGYHLARIRPNKDTYGNYLFWSFTSNGIRDQFEMLANGITRFGIGKYTIDNSLFLFPPISEQQSIAIFLNHQNAKIDTDIEIIQNQITLLKEYRTALISEAVTGKIDLRNKHEISISK